MDGDTSCEADEPFSFPGVSAQPAGRNAAQAEPSPLTLPVAPAQPSDSPRNEVQTDSATALQPELATQVVQRTPAQPELTPADDAAENIRSIDDARQKRQTDPTLPAIPRELSAALADANIAYLWEQAVARNYWRVSYAGLMYGEGLTLNERRANWIRRLAALDRVTARQMAATMQEKLDSQQKG